MSQSSKVEVVIKSVATAVTATVIVEAGLNVAKRLTKQPIVLLGLGIATGYFTHKYRKEIIALGSHTAEQSKEFIVRQKQHLDEFLAETHGNSEQEN